MQTLGHLVQTCDPVQTLASGITFHCFYFRFRASVCVWCVCMCVDCRENAVLQGVYHPGLFVNSKWSCCDHRSKHSQGCTPSFCGSHQDHAATNHVSPVKSSGVARGPLPPTPSDDVAPTPPPHRYLQTHGPIPNAIQSYEDHNPNTAQERGTRRKGAGGGGGGGGGGSNRVEERKPEPIPPPVPVSWRGGCSTEMAYCN